MKKEVMVKIKGVQKYPEGERVETVTEEAGEYFWRNGNQYVRFEEHTEGFAETSRCLLKISAECVEITKKGLVISHMIFEKDHLHRTQYRTPFGIIMMGTKAKYIQRLEEENAIAIQIAYDLFAEDEYMAESNIRIMVKSK